MVRIVAWVLLAVTICVGALIAYSMYAAELAVTVDEVRVVPAGDMMEQFQALQRAVQERALLGRQFQEDPLGDSYAYEFHIYTVRLRNNGLIPADWIRLEVQPEVGDVLQSDGESTGMLPAMSSGELQAVVLAHRGSDTARKLSLTYFIWSRLYNITLERP